MSYKITKLLTIFAIVTALTATGLGQQQSTSTQSKPAEYVETTGFKGRVFEVKNRKPSDIIRAISPLGSGFRGATMTYNEETQTISVRDFPENLAVVEEAIKRLDVPQPAKSRDQNLDMRMYLLIASNVDGASNQYPDDLKDVIKQLQGTLSYKNYYLLTPIVQRLWAPSGVRSEGVTTVGPPLFEKSINTKYSYSISQFLPEPSDGNTKTMLLNNFEFSISGVYQDETNLFGSARISNKLVVRDGEKVVLGTASLRDKALVIVLSVKTIP